MAMIPWKRKYGWDPFRELENLHRNMNSLFDMSLSRWPDERGDILTTGYDWSPSIDIQDRKDKLIVTAELPGMDKEDVKISLEEDRLVIKGEKKHEEEKEEKGYYRRECSYGSFQRVLDLPAQVKTDNADASYKNGVLKITLPKKEESKSKVIDIDIK